MRKIVLAASILASVAAPALAQGRHHIKMPVHAGDFVGLADAAGATVGTRFDATSPNLASTLHRCAWTATCDY